MGGKHQRQAPVCHGETLADNPPETQENWTITPLALPSPSFGLFLFVACARTLIVSGRTSLASVYLRADRIDFTNCPV